VEREKIPHPCLAYAFNPILCNDGFYYLIGKANFPYENLFLNQVLFRALIEGWIFISVLFVFIFVWVLLSKKLNEIVNEVSFYVIVGMIIIMILPLIMALTF